MSGTSNQTDLERGPGGESWAFSCPLLQCFERPMVLVLVKLEGITSLEEPAQERHKENGAYFVSMRVRWANGRYRNESSVAE